MSERWFLKMCWKFQLGSAELSWAEAGSIGWIGSMPRILGFWGSEILGFSDSRILGFSDSRVPGGCPGGQDNPEDTLLGHPLFAIENDEGVQWSKGNF